jgi:PKD repeat protein
LLVVLASCAAAQCGEGIPACPVRFSTYLGGTGTDAGWDVALDSRGAPAMVGFTDSFALGPDLAGEHAGGFGHDGFAARFDVEGQLVYLTYLGSTDDDKALGCAFLGEDLLVVGRTASRDLRVTRESAFQPDYGGGSRDAFLVRLSAEGEIVYSTFLGGSGEDSSCSLVVEGSVVTICGHTESRAATFPVTADAYQKENRGQSDIFLTRLDLSRTGSDQLLYSTFIGGSDHEVFQSEWPQGAHKESLPRLALSPDGAYVIGGRTGSTNFPVSPGAFQPMKQTAMDGVVLKLDPRLAGAAQLVYSTYLGGSSSAVNDSVNAVAVEPDGTIVVAGHTGSTDLPPTPGAFRDRFQGGYNDGFVARIAPDASLPTSGELLYLTYLGGARGGDGYDYITGIVVNGPGDVTVLGSTGATDFPTTPGAYQREALGWPDFNDSAFFLTRLRLDLTLPPEEQLIYSTLVGGCCGELNTIGLAADAAGGVYFCGLTDSGDYPMVGAYQDANAGGNDATLTRFDLRVPEARFASDADGRCVEVGALVAFDGGASTPSEGTRIVGYDWDFGDSVAAAGAAVTHAYAEPGRYAVSLSVTNDAGLVRTTIKTVCVRCAAASDPWLPADIGPVAFPGAAGPWADTRSLLEICAGGSGLASTGDELFFAYQEVAGDFALTAHFSRLEDALANAEVGLMVRGGGLHALDPLAPFGAAALRVSGTVAASQRGRSRLRFRESGGEDLETRNEVTLPGAGLAAIESWLRIERRGSRVTASSSLDGSSWTELGQAEVELPGDNVLAGFYGAARDFATPGVTFRPLRAVVSIGDPEPTGPLFHRGDPNASGTIDLSDAIAIFTHLFLGEAYPSCLESANANNDGAIDISDGIHLLRWLFTGGPEPAPPGPTSAPCGLDPDPAGSPGDLGCLAYEPCQ